MKARIFIECVVCLNLFPGKGNEQYCSGKCLIKNKIKILQNQCWEYQGGCNLQGYPIIHFHSKQYSGNRFSYKTFTGDIPKGMNVCHTCDNPKCMNPDHLWLGTTKENAIDCVKKGRRKPNKGCFSKSQEFSERGKLFYKLWKDGKKIWEIAEESNIPYHKVYNPIRSHCKSINEPLPELMKGKISFSKYSRNQCCDVIMLKNKGYTYKHISDVTGVKKSACKYIVKHKSRIGST